MMHVSKSNSIVTLIPFHNFRESIDMMQKNFVFRQLSGYMYTSTRKIHFPFTTST